MNRADHLLALRARRRHGVFTRTDALECGLSDRALDHRIKSRTYEVLWPGTYALAGSPSTWERSATAAVVYAAPVAALSHCAAARMYSVSGFERASIEVTTSRQIQAVNFKARTSLEPADVGSRNGIPTTNVERLLLDLSSVLEARRLEAMIDQVCDKRLTTAERISTYLQRNCLPKRRRSVLLRLLDDRGRVKPAAGDLETLVARLMREPSLLQPVRQFEVRHNGELIARPDFAYPEVKFGIEAHSFDFHHTRAEWERDLERHRELEAIGWYIMYVTWDDCVLRRDQTVARIRRVLDERRRLFGLDPLPRWA
jgi:very-short-patch-repair endonuclease